MTMNTRKNIRAIIAVVTLALIAGLQIEPYRRDPTDDMPVPEDSRLDAKVGNAKMLPAFPLTWDYEHRTNINRGIDLPSFGFFTCVAFLALAVYILI